MKAGFEHNRIIENESSLKNISHKKDRKPFFNLITRHLHWNSCFKLFMSDVQKETVFYLEISFFIFKL